MIILILKKLETIMKLNQIFLKVNHCGKQLEDSIKLSTSLVIHHKQDVEFPSLNKEMALFEATGNKSKYLNLVDQALRTIPPTSVEAERAFSAAGLFITKLRILLNLHLLRYCLIQNIP